MNYPVLQVAEPCSISSSCEAKTQVLFPRVKLSEEHPVALVNVPYGDTKGSMRPLGLAYLGAFLRRQGIPTIGYDFSDSSHSPTHLVENYGLMSHPIVGLSFYNSNCKLAFDIAREIKRRSHNAIVVAGGPHASATHHTISRRHPEIDLVVRGEGEESFLELVRSLTQGRNLVGLPGVSGNSFANPDRERLRDLDCLPAPVFDFVRDGEREPIVFYDRHERRFRKSTAVVSSRSCPFRCSFCAIILIGRKWRRNSPAKIVEDIRALEESQAEIFEHIYFLDANFFVDHRRTVEVARELQSFRDGITFSFSTRVNQLMRGAKSIGKLKRLGLRAVELGIESGSLDALKRFTKDTTPQQNAEAIALLRKHGIQLLMDFIMFDAETNVADLDANLRFLEKNGLDTYVPWDHLFSYMTPYLGTAIRDRYEELGIPLEEDRLPEPESIIQNPSVRLVFRQLNNFRPMMRQLPSALQSIERGLHGMRWSKEKARLMLNAAFIRRLPYVVFRNLVDQSLLQESINLERAIPSCFDDQGNPLTVQEFLDHVLR